MEANDEVIFMKVLVLADTHVPSRCREMPDEVWDLIEEADAVIHAGDFDSHKVYQQIEEKSGQLFAVFGNMDSRSLHRSLEDNLNIELEDVKITLTHGHRWGRPRPSRLARRFVDETDVLVYGHLHQPVNRRFQDMLILNPGSPTDPRSGAPTYAWLTLDEGQAQAEIMEL